MEEKQPASSMVRIPTPLIPVVRELSRLHRQGKTEQLLQGLEVLIAAIDSSSDSKGDSSIVATDSSVIADLIARIERLESAVIQPAINSPQQPAEAPPVPTEQAIAPSSDESVEPSGDGWLTLKEVAAAIGANYSRLSDSRGEMSEEEFLDYLYQRTLEKRKPQHWEFDRNAGRRGMFRPVPH